jgi:hypothetical protein
MTLLQGQEMTRKAMECVTTKQHFMFSTSTAIWEAPYATKATEEKKEAKENRRP